MSKKRLWLRRRGRVVFRVRIRVQSLMMRVML